MTLVILFNIETAFATDRKKIHLLITEVFLCTAAGNLARSKKKRDWYPRNANLLPPLLTEAAILHGESDAGELLNIFSCSITEWASDADSLSKADESNDYDSIAMIEAAEAKKPVKAKQAFAKTVVVVTLDTIVDNCDDVMAFLQVVAVKFPQVPAALFSLCAEKRARVWFQQWTDVNLPNPPTPAPQDHLGLTGVLTDVVTRLHTDKALRPVVAAQRESEKKTKGWDRLPPTA